MARSYLVCLLGDRGEVVGRNAFDAEGDPAAVAHVRLVYPQHHCDLWQLGRYVALIPGAVAAARERAARSLRESLGFYDDDRAVPAA